MVRVIFDNYSRPSGNNKSKSSSITQSLDLSVIQHLCYDLGVFYSMLELKVATKGMMMIILMTMMMMVMVVLMVIGVMMFMMVMVMLMMGHDDDDNDDDGSDDDDDDNDDDCCAELYNCSQSYNKTIKIT